MTHIDTSIASEDAIGRLKTEIARKTEMIASLQRRCDALVHENLARSKEIAALRRKRAQEETTALTPKKR